MSVRIAAGAALLACSAAAAADDIAYEITLQDKAGVETQTVTLPKGAAARKLPMAGAVIEIQPPSQHEAKSVITLLPSDEAHAQPLHITRILAAEGRPLRIAYSLCDAKVRFYAPTPRELLGCK